MADKKKIILTILAAISLLVWLRGFGVFSKNKQAREAAIIKTSGPILSAPQGMAVPRTRYKDYKRNPFSAADLGRDEGPGLQLGGIISDNEGLYALINDQVVRAGDSVGANKVIDIKENKVILNDGGKDIELKLEE
ncbi:hypothetical protein EPN16_00395 [bacterium]|nr:MAG: hypothetical protein EPN16_00395 [bacterium]